METFRQGHLFIRKWASRLPPKATIVIAHGMSEHSARYAHFAGFLNEQGFIVYANDHRGHGKTAKNIQNIGHDQSPNIWHSMAEDLDAVLHLAQSQNNNLPLFLFAHSMGSFLTQSYLCHYDHSNLSGVILSGSNHGSNPLILIGRWVAKFERMRQGPIGKSPLIHRMSFAGFNDRFKDDGCTGFEWLSRDMEQVQAYNSDPYCGFQCSNQFWHDFLGGLLKLRRGKAYSNINPKLPILLISGDQDPVGEYGKGVSKLFAQLKHAGLHVSLKLYNDGRHELLNETNQNEAYDFVHLWLNQHLIK